MGFMSASVRRQLAHAGAAFAQETRLQEFGRNTSGSVSVMAATLLALLLGLGTLTIRSGELYAEKLRNFRTADLAARTAARQEDAPEAQTKVASTVAKQNGANTGKMELKIHKGRVLHRFPCGIEIWI